MPLTSLLPQQPSLLRLLRDMHANGFGAGTFKITRAALSAAYNDAVRLGDLVRNPVLNTKMPNVTAKTTKPLPRTDWEKGLP